MIRCTVSLVDIAFGLDNPGARVPTSIIQTPYRSSPQKWKKWPRTVKARSALSKPRQEWDSNVQNFESVTKTVIPSMGITSVHLCMASAGVIT